MLSVLGVGEDVPGWGGSGLGLEFVRLDCCLGPVFKGGLNDMEPTDRELSRSRYSSFFEPRLVEREKGEKTNGRDL